MKNDIETIINKYYRKPRKYEFIFRNDGTIKYRLTRLD